MTSTIPILGTVINQNDVTDKVTGSVAVSITLAVGLVYQDAANGWKNAPTDGSIDGDRLYWNHTALTSTATLGEIVGTFYGNGSRVVGKSDGIITAGNWCKASTSFANGFITNDLVAATIGATFGSGTATETAIDAVRDWQLAKVARYIGHCLEVVGNETNPTSSADLDVNCVFEIQRG